MIALHSFYHSLMNTENILYSSVNSKNFAAGLGALVYIDWLVSQHQGRTVRHYHVTDPCRRCYHPYVADQLQADSVFQSMPLLLYWALSNRG